MTCQRQVESAPPETRQATSPPGSTRLCSRIEASTRSRSSAGSIGSAYGGSAVVLDEEVVVGAAAQCGVEPLGGGEVQRRVGLCIDHFAHERVDERVLG